MNRTDYIEKQTYGALKWKTYFTFFKVSGGIFGSILFFFILITSQVSILTTEYWLNRWAAIEYQQFTKPENMSEFSNKTIVRDHINYKNRLNSYHIYSGSLIKLFLLIKLFENLICY